MSLFRKPSATLTSHYRRRTDWLLLTSTPEIKSELPVEYHTEMAERWELCNKDKDEDEMASLADTVCT